jgi:hypothetical protein
MQKNKLFVIVFVIDWFTGFSDALGCDDDLFLVSPPPTRNKIGPVPSNVLPLAKWIILISLLAVATLTVSPLVDGTS